jgi:hypothetical protein
VDCPICGGSGLATFEGAGPSVEPCTSCRGTGRLIDDLATAFTELLREKGVMLDRDMRLLLLALEALESRVRRLEADRL